MSESQGYITKDQDTSDQDASDHGRNFDARDFYGNDHNDAGNADATGGDNQGDINLNIEQGGDAYAHGGDVVTYESYEQHSYGEYRGPEYDDHGKYDDSDKYEDHGHDQGCHEAHDSADNVF